jgi:hypothetical protein
MGLNVNLIPMLNLPATTTCPNCKKPIATGFEDYDIEGGNPYPSPGVWRLHVYCPYCEEEFAFTHHLKIELVSILPYE